MIERSTEILQTYITVISVTSKACQERLDSIWKNSEEKQYIGGVSDYLNQMTTVNAAGN